MSWKAMKWAYEQQGTTPVQKAVLLAIAYHFSDKQRCAWPSHQTMADITNLGRSTVIRTVIALQDELGLIEITKSVNASGRQTSNRYHLPDLPS